MTSNYLIRIRPFLLFWAIFALLLGNPCRSYAVTDIVACFGDSITSGYSIYIENGNGCLPPCGGYQLPLNNYLHALGHSVLIRNYGVNGEMTAEGLRRFSSVLTVSGARYVFILEGTNDALFFSPGTILTNLTSMVDQALALNVVPVLGTLTPDSRYAKPIAEINRRIRELAMARNILLADHDTAVGSNWPQLTSDGLHPNASGYAVLAQSWAQSFSNLGDINGDGMLNLVDTILALQIVSGKILSEPINLDADVDGDGKIGMSEAIRTLHVIQLWQ